MCCWQETCQELSQWDCPAAMLALAPLPLADARHARALLSVAAASVGYHGIVPLLMLTGRCTKMCLPYGGFARCAFLYVLLGVPQCGYQRAIAGTFMRATTRVWCHEIGLVECQHEIGPAEACHAADLYHIAASLLPLNLAVGLSQLSNAGSNAGHVWHTAVSLGVHVYSS
jgi:hypothetical protein